VNQGGEPGHDDYGLPPVDIQIPDDARELDRDVQAYHRELRALRRHERSNRWRAPLRRSSMIVPLVASCLVLAMVAGMVLTMFSANPYLSRLDSQRTTGAETHRSGQAIRSRAPTAPPSATNSPAGLTSPAAGHLPPGKIIVAGKRVNLRSIPVPTALAIVPVNCACAAMIAQLLSQARAAGVKVYLIGKPGVSVAHLRRLARAVPSAEGPAMVARDPDDALKSISRSTGPTIVLVDARGRTVEPPLSPPLHLEQPLRHLAQAH
jgi:hypothetical protein